MRSDFNDIDVDELETDVCVVGAGAAGIALVHRLLGTKLRVILLESGGMEPAQDSEALNDGSNVGASPVDLRSSRRRLYGGTTRLWAGQCVPLDATDFEARPWVPRSGWPVSLDDLAPHYRQAERLMRIGEATYDYGDPTWGAFRMRPPPIDHDRLRHRVTVWPRRVDLGRLTAAEVKRSQNVHLLLHANAVRVRASSDGSRAEGVEVRSLRGRRAVVRAAAVVLCAGTVENARLLLASGLGNRHDLVGRYFQEHPNAQAATLHEPRHRYLQDHYALLYRRGRRYLPRLSLAPAVQEAEQVLNCTSLLVFEHGEMSGAGAAKAALRAIRARRPPPEIAATSLRAARNVPSVASVAWRRFGRGRSPGTPPERVRLQVFCEQAPQPESRVTLSDRHDALGERLPQIDWRLAEIDGRTARTMVATVAAELGRLGLGRLEADSWVLADRPEREGRLRDSYHHIGTTRMGADPRAGVVDANCRVHDVERLYVGGASVFPTSGWANPTLTAMALCMRLAQQLRKELAP